MNLERAQCIYSLTNTMKSRIFNTLTQKSVIDCTELGYAIGTRNFSFCVLSKRATNTANEEASNGVASRGTTSAALEEGGQTGPGQFPRNLSDTSLGQREEYACAEIGIDPGDAGFDACVQDLDLALYLARHPPSTMGNPYG